MSTSIFDLTPTVASDDLSGKYILLYSKPKFGKTSFAAQLKKNLFLATEIGYHAINGITAMPILKWSDLKRAVKELKDPRGREVYDTVTIDTISLAAELCEKYILQREGVTSLREIPWGQGWKMVAQELQDTLRDITMMGYGLILICHSKEKASPMVDSEGNNLTSVEPDLSKNVYTICNAICDLIAYIDVEFDEHGVGKRWIYTRATPTIFAGSRWKYLDPKIPFSYEELVAAIGRAIHQAANEDGVSVAEHTETVAIKNRPFQEIMDEARTLWQAYMDNVANDEEREQHYNIVKDIIKRIFGTEDFKLSQAVPSQGDLVEYFISELKDIMKPE